jgi:hypothetical protein
VQFEIGEMVWLRVHHHRQSTIGRKEHPKLGRKFQGPYRITEKISNVAYRLQLPSDARVHDVFHVSLLRPFCGSHELPSMPRTTSQGTPQGTPSAAAASPSSAILAKRTIKQGGKNQIEVLVEWTGSTREDATWVPLEQLQREFPNTNLEPLTVC